MFTDEVLEQIAKGFLEKSRAGYVRWQAVDRGPIDVEGYAVLNALAGGLGIGPTRFSVQLPQSRLSIDYLSPPAAADVITFDVCNNDDAVVATLIGRDGEERWGLLRDLYYVASRIGSKSDGILEEIQAALDGDEIIGQETTDTSLVAADFLKWVAGEWLLTFTQPGRPPRAESVTIQPDGTYCSKGKPIFQLTEIKATKDTVEWNKTCLPAHPQFKKDGTVRTPENLIIVQGGNAMIGTGRGGPEHYLDYRRKT